MTQATVHGRPGAVWALGVIAAHLLVIDHLRLQDAPAPGAVAASRSAPGVRAHLVEPEAGPERAAADRPHAAGPASTGPGPGPGAASSLPNAVPARAAPSMHLRYAISGQSREHTTVSGQAELAWTQDGLRYEARFTQDGEGVPRRSQHSAGRLTAQGLAPERFSQRARHEEAVHFEREAGRAVFSALPRPAPLRADAQDRLSLLLQLGARIAARPQAYPAGTHVELQTTTTRDALIWRFRIEGSEELSLPGGNLTSMRLVRLPLGTFEPEMTLWLAPALDYAPVRLRLTHRTGGHLDYQWSGTDRR